MLRDDHIIKSLQFHYFLIGYRTIDSKCTEKGSLTFCQQCLHSDQCKKPYWCCPMSRLCIKKACSDCRDHEWAKCWPFCRDSMNPQDCTCKNSKFPSNPFTHEPTFCKQNGCFVTKRGLYLKGEGSLRDPSPPSKLPSK